MKSVLKKFLVVFVLGVSVSLSFAQEVKKIKVYLLAGQSNMQGAGLVWQLKPLLCAANEYSIEGNQCYEGLPLYNRLFETITDFYRVPGQSEPQYQYDAQLAQNEANELVRLYKDNLFRGSLVVPLANVNMMGIGYYGRTEDGTLHNPDVRYGKLEARYGYSTDHFGPELMIGHWLKRYTQDDILLIKVAQGGTTLYEDWRSPTMAQRLPPTPKESLYNKLIYWTNNTIQNIGTYFPEYAGQNIQVDIQGLIWFQGFNDMFNEEHINTYQANLIDFINDVRHDLSLPNLPVAVATDAHDSPEGIRIQQAQQNVVSQMPHTNYTVTRDLSAYYHYDSGSPVVVGERLAENLWQLIPCSSFKIGENGKKVCIK